MPTENTIKNERGYTLRTPRYDRVYLFYERGNTVHGYRFINEDDPPKSANDMLIAYRDKYTQVRLTVSRFDYLFRRQLFAIEKLKAPNMPDNDALVRAAVNESLKDLVKTRIERGLNESLKITDELLAAYPEEFEDTPAPCNLPDIIAFKNTYYGKTPCFAYISPDGGSIQLDRNFIQTFIYRNDVKRSDVQVFAIDENDRAQDITNEFEFRSTTNG